VGQEPIRTGAFGRFRVVRFGAKARKAIGRLRFTLVDALHASGAQALSTSNLKHPEHSPDQELPPFLPGAELCRLFYEEAVRPIMERCFLGLRYGAARLDNGSDVLGFDTAISMDHGWGPRLNLYIADAEYSDSLGAEIRRVMAEDLPFEIRGFPTNLAGSGRSMQRTTRRPINHNVGVGPVGATSGATSTARATRSVTALFPPRSGWSSPNSSFGRSHVVRSTVTTRASSHSHASGCAGTGTTSGSIFWRPSGSALGRKKRSPGAVVTWATKWGP
jgi:hypothetical protein